MTPKSNKTDSLCINLRSPGFPWGFAACSPKRTRVEKLISETPRFFISISIIATISCSVIPFTNEALQIGIDSLVEGITEQEIVAIIDMEMKKRGVSEMSFSTLVLFGDHAANPHGNPGDRKLKQNEFVLFDLGVIYNGYASDVTR